MHGLLVAGFFDQGFFHALLTVAIAVCWAFALYDLATRELSGRKKAVWLVVILILPIAGTLIYLLSQHGPAIETSESIDSVQMQDPRATMLTPPGI